MAEGMMCTSYGVDTLALVGYGAGLLIGFALGVLVCWKMGREL